MNTTNTKPTSKLGRIWPSVGRGSVGEELSHHPKVIDAFLEADRLLTGARARGTQLIASAFEFAVRDTANRRLKASRQM
jgi:hypothetical protein